MQVGIKILKITKRLQGETLTERDYALREGTNFTPSLIFYDAAGAEVLRLRGKGLPPLQPGVDPARLERVRGELYVRIFVEVPTSLSLRQRELLEEFARETDTEISPASKSFMNKLRDFFE